MREIQLWDFGYESAELISQKMFQHIQNPDPIASIWIGEHPSVLTLGASAKEQDCPQKYSISTLKVPRGGRATLHMPGQLMLYPLIPLKEFSLTLRSWVHLLEETIFHTFPQDLFLRCQGEPGVYLPKGKVASLGVKISKGWSTFGLCLNVSCTLDPFQKIIPCGLKNRPITSLYDSKISFHSMKSLKNQILKSLLQLLENQKLKTQV